MTSLSADVVALLRQAGVPPGCVLQVHSSFRSLGRAGITPQALIEALLEALGAQGTLLMPAMTWRTVTPAQPLFDESETPSHTGILTELFRRKYATYRSLHPTHSMSGCGPLAEYLLGTHHLGTTPVPLCSPYGKMREVESHVLMIGVGLGSCTAFHHPEELIAPEVYLQPAAAAETYVLRDRRGQQREFSLRRHKRVPRDFEKFRAPLTLEGTLRSGGFKTADWTSVTLAPLMQHLFSALSAHPTATLKASLLHDGNADSWGDGPRVKAKR